MIRLDRHDVVYKNQAGKYRAILAQIEECHQKGQPVLVGTISVDKSEYLSSLLKKQGIPHNVLNAKQHEREAEIVAQAGKFGAVTISTNMAGRGTDIMLGGNAEFLAKIDLKKNGYSEEEIAAATGMSDEIDERCAAARALFRERLEKYKEQIAPEAARVRAAGGLFILGTERHESRRIDNQLRGRSGRQGDPGESRFYLSLEDDLMRLFGSERILGIIDRLGLDEDQPIDAKILSGSIENAQKRLEGENFSRRKTVLEYDDVMNQQRNVIYKQRREVLDGEDISGKIQSMLEKSVTEKLDSCMSEGGFDVMAAKEMLLWITTPDDFRDGITREELESTLLDRVHSLYGRQEAVFGERMRELERVALLCAVDTNWMTHLDAMDDLRDGVGLNSFAQRNPLTEYRISSGEMFDDMIDKIRTDTVRMVLFAKPAEELRRKEVAKQKSAELAAVGGEKAKPRPVVRRASERVGRNDPCPCGSGKKYKQCCGKPGGGADAHEGS